MAMMMPNKDMKNVTCHVEVMASVGAATRCLTGRSSTESQLLVKEYQLPPCLILELPLPAFMEKATVAASYCLTAWT